LGQAARDYIVSIDYLTPRDADMDLLDVLERARAVLRNRRHDAEGADGLDHARQTLRWLRTTNVPEPWLILRSMEGLIAFPDIMRMFTEPEFVDLHHRVLITTEPNYLAGWTSHPQVVSYQRRFMRAARHVNEAQQASRLAGELQDTTL